MAESERETREDRLRQFHRTTPDSPMGKLLRRFWHPIALADTLKKGTTQPVRMLSQDLTLYRGESGAPHLIAERCAHRCTALHTGWIEGERLRCMYHGWLYDAEGQCLEMPADHDGDPEAVKIAAYPVHEYRGLIFAYLGGGKAPVFDLPRKDVLERDDRHYYAGVQIWDCNWFQQIENSMDSAHIGFAHTWGAESRFQQEITTAVPRLEYQEMSSGVRQIATRGVNNVRVSNWTFPNNNHIVTPGPTKSDPWIDRVVWAVPVDDVTTARFAITSAPEAGAEANARIEAEYTTSFNPADHAAEMFFGKKIPDVRISDVISAQDYVAVRGQGQIVNRLNERLAQSDVGIAFLRRIFRRELIAIENGQEPKNWTRLAEEIDLPIQTPEKAAS